MAEGKAVLSEDALLPRITTDPAIFGGKPIIRGHRLAVEHVLGMLAAGDTPETVLRGYAWLEPDDIRACLVYARRVVGHERVEPALTSR
jgi:uncharacterized protein (DUF433 family)